ncbi:unnamed protein product [Dovyalis caffra]|uniref:Uncharacterized protein n=1 Tax=Dovyalis caffra TaxID=77055 RepID=A0AAV1SQZ4_9ROSI|nr:unnamed protein product [Dovyalis caffra]
MDALHGVLFRYLKSRFQRGGKAHGMATIFLQLKRMDRSGWLKGWGNKMESTECLIDHRNGQVRWSSRVLTATFV